MNRITHLCCFFTAFVFGQHDGASVSNPVWVPDNGDGTYKNPVINSDYSDPDAVRVGDTFYMTASSFNCIPGLPILESKDLVNWRIIGHALNRQAPDEIYELPQHGKGVWAPCIRYRDNAFYIYYADPDYGIYATKAPKATGPWSLPVLIKAGKGLIDPSPLWDDDGKGYLVHAFAGSRAGIKSKLVVCTLSSDGLSANDDAVLIIDGARDETTIEGPKFYKRNGYYYIFAPAGGVPSGWQTVLRAKSIYGPYEKRKVLEQGRSLVNGPHQGAWVQTQNDEDWFLHFQDKGLYGRVVHLQPMRWVADWPVIGSDNDQDGTGEPVRSYRKPDTRKPQPISAMPDSDEFNGPEMGLQWQWHANPKPNWGFPSALGYYMLNCMPKPSTASNLYEVPNLLLQKFPGEQFTATAKLEVNFHSDGEEAGLLVMGLDYALLKIGRTAGKFQVAQMICKNADKQEPENQVAKFACSVKDAVYLRVEVVQNGFCTFSYSEDGQTFKKVGIPFQAREGRWIGAKLGFVALRDGVTNDAGNIKIDWIRFHT